MVYTGNANDKPNNLKIISNHTLYVASNIYYSFNKFQELPFSHLLTLPFLVDFCLLLIELGDEQGDWIRFHCKPWKLYDPNTMVFEIKRPV